MSSSYGLWTRGPTHNKLHFAPPPNHNPSLNNIQNDRPRRELTDKDLNPNQWAEDNPQAEDNAPGESPDPSGGGPDRNGGDDDEDPDNDRPNMNPNNPSIREPLILLGRTIADRAHPPPVALATSVSRCLKVKLTGRVGWLEPPETEELPCILQQCLPSGARDIFT